MAKKKKNFWENIFFLIYWYFLATSLQVWVKQNIFGFSIINTTKHNAFRINHYVPLIRKFLSLTFLVCIAEIVGSTHLGTLLLVLAYQKLSTMKFSVVWFFLWLRNAEFFNFAPEFIVCGALCIKYQSKSPFFSKIVMAARLRASPLDPARQILSVSSFLDSGWPLKVGN